MYACQRPKVLLFRFVCLESGDFSEVKIDAKLQLIVHFTKYSVKCGCYQRGGPAVTILLVHLSACSSSYKTLCPLTEAAPAPHLLLLVSAESPHLHPPAFSLPLYLLLIIALHLHPLLCKGDWGTAQYAKDYGGMLSRKGRQTLTRHFHCAPPSQQSAHRGLIWLSHSLSLFAPAVPPPDLRQATLSTLLSPPCFSPSRLCTG